METIETVPNMRALAGRLRSRPGGLALVPTMGALHAGHEALIGAAVAAGAPVVVSIFVNPLSFGASENFAGYPRSREADLALCGRLGVAAVFMPPPEEIYPRGFSTQVSEEAVSRTLCGVSRPTHFRGVATLATKLLNIVGPDRLYVGQKDAQHAAVLRKVVADLNYTVEIVVVPTVREADGLAAGVRNGELTPALRQESLAISAALRKVGEMVESGVRSSDRLVAEATHILGRHNRVRVIYASIVDSSTMEPIREVVPGRTLMCIAAWVNEIRLTDNAVL
jgi:pantoate--beta-alanine ligase